MNLYAPRLIDALIDRRQDRRRDLHSAQAQAKPFMTIAVFDTNVVVSGILSTTGAPGRILDAILDGFCQPAVTDAILAEYEEVLSRPNFRFPPAKIRLLLAAMRTRLKSRPLFPLSASKSHE